MPLISFVFLQPSTATGTTKATKLRKSDYLETGEQLVWTEGWQDYIEMRCTTTPSIHADLEYLLIFWIHSFKQCNLPCFKKCNMIFSKAHCIPLSECIFLSIQMTRDNVNRLYKSAFNVSKSYFGKDKDQYSGYK